MKPYIGTKTLNAKPMTRGLYNEFRGWALPVDENPDDHGYLVEYTDGGKANTEAFNGYVSWSPKDVFERAYSEVVVSSRLPHEQRVVEEKAELDARLANLIPFLSSDTCHALPFDERSRLKRQAEVMEMYSGILGASIAAFNQD